MNNLEARKKNALSHLYHRIYSGCKRADIKVDMYQRVGNIERVAIGTPEDQFLTVKMVSILAEANNEPEVTRYCIHYEGVYLGRILPDEVVNGNVSTL